MANISFGERIRRGRAKNAWSQLELAEKLGVAQTTISNWEIGRVAPEREQKLRLRSTLGLVQGGANSEPIPPVAEQIGPSAFGAWLNRTRLERTRGWRQFDDWNRR